MPDQKLLEGGADHYKQFLRTFNSATLLEVSNNLKFTVRTVQAPTLLVREIRINGQASNELTYGDAFFGLILSKSPGCFSASAPLTENGAQTEAPSLHWHWPNQLATSHHHNSDVIYLRLESASLLRQLALQGLSVQHLRELQAVAAPPSLVQLLHALSQRLITLTDTRASGELVEEFYRSLGLELRNMLNSTSLPRSSASRHVSAAIELMREALAAPFTLPQLSAELGLTPRSIQASFRSCVGMSPMRWLKLARFSQLRQLLHSPELGHLSAAALMSRLGLNNNDLNRRHYRDIYGATPRDDQHWAERQRQNGVKLTCNDSQVFHFSSMDAAIAALQQERIRQTELQADRNHSVLVTISVSSATTPAGWQLQRAS